MFSVADPYFRFWFRFIDPNLGAIDRGFGKHLVDETILPQLDSHVEHVFEEIARAFVSRLVQAGELEATDVGSWWSTDGQREIDIVGLRSPTDIRRQRQVACGVARPRRLQQHATVTSYPEV